MKSTGIIRPVDGLGRIVLPIELRRLLNIKSKDPLEIYIEDGKIVLKKHESCCIFCGSEEEVSTFKGHSVCSKCRAELKKKPAAKRRTAKPEPEAL